MQRVAVKFRDNDPDGDGKANTFGMALEAAKPRDLIQMQLAGTARYRDRDGGSMKISIEPVEIETGDMQAEQWLKVKPGSMGPQLDAVAAPRQMSWR